jgi:hypothetical protein
MKSGGEYAERHVLALKAQVGQWLPEAEFVVLSDKRIANVKCVPLVEGWPGWWSKMELFRPDLEGDILFMDLDTVVQGPLQEIAAVGELTICQDFYRSYGLQSSLMYLPRADRGEVWRAFKANPAYAMHRAGRRGDQSFLEQHYLHRAKRWQKSLPNQVVSYKVDCQNGVPLDANVVIFHGTPRPWATTEFSSLYG